MGVIEENSTLDSYIFLPLSTASIRITGQKYYSQIIAVITDAEKVDAKEAEIDALMQDVLEVEDPNSLPYNIRNQAELLENFSSITETLTMLLSGIAGISLLVGGIGVMNIMLVSVTERTKEIGIRKALGASPRSIVSIILIESIIITAIAGYVGLLAGVGMLEAAGPSLEEYFIKDPGVSNGLVIGATLTLIIAGAIAGYLPAKKAAKKLL